MQWFARLGREVDLCTAEVAAMSSEKIIPTCGFALGEAEPPDWNLLGGVVKAGQVLTPYPVTTRELVSVITKQLKPIEGKRHLGLSAPGMQPYQLKRLGQTIKKQLVNSGQSIRMIYPVRGHELNTAQLDANHLLDPPHLEINLIATDRAHWLLGKTSWRQDILSYTQRDRGRPARNARVGMLPPKLAQIMLNLAGVQANDHVHDPFCGTGVVLIEALLKHAHVSGSDIAADMVAATCRNLDWAQSNLPISASAAVVSRQDARLLQLPASTTHIVAEGYLGNTDLAGQVRQRMQTEAQSLRSLYIDFFHQILKYPKPLTIVLALPVWYPQRGVPIELDILDDLPYMGYTLEKFAPTDRIRLHYHRRGQTVGRSIIKLRKD